MNDRERFVAIARGQTPDFTPIFGFPGAPGMSHGCLRPTHERLVAGGMPAFFCSFSRPNPAQYYLFIKL